MGSVMYDNEQERRILASSKKLNPHWKIPARKPFNFRDKAMQYMYTFLSMNIFAPEFSMSIASPAEPPPRRYIPGTPVPRDQCPSCHFISSAVPIGLGVGSYWYFLLYWEAQARQNPPPKIRVPYGVKKSFLAAGCFSLVGYGIYRLFWKQPGTPGLF